MGYSDYTHKLAGGLAYGGLEKAEMPRGAEDAGGVSGVRSLFNDYHIFSYGGGGANMPLLDAPPQFIARTPEDLINRPRGASIYKPADFLYCSRLGMPINRLITLRRFPHPCFDDIFSNTAQTEPDIARMVAFGDQENNAFNELIKFSWGFKWKPLSAVSERASMAGPDGGVGGYMQKVLKFVDGKYGQEAAMGETRLNFDPQHDQNRVYGPVDSIAETHIRDIGLEFGYSASIRFEYDMQSINGISPKAAFIDLLSNILACTFNNGKFWGGARYWVGPRPTKFMDNLKFLAPNDLNDFLSKGQVELKGLFGKGDKMNAVDVLKDVAYNAINLNLGKVLDTVGRPGIIMMNSLLRNEPVGEWHLTVGNPLNPIFCMGDLVMERCEVEFGSQLGYDDFPTSFSATVTLKPSKARDRSQIESMFSCGRGRTYWKPESGDPPGNGAPKAGALHNFDKAARFFGSFTSSDVKRAGERAFDFAQKIGAGAAAAASDTGRNLSGEAPRPAVKSTGGADALLNSVKSQ